MAKKLPPTKAELDKLNAEIKRLKAPQTPQMAPAPGGPMQQQATKVQIAARQNAIDVREKQKEAKETELFGPPNTLRRDFNQER